MRRYLVSGLLAVLLLSGCAATNSTPAPAGTNSAPTPASSNSASTPAGAGRGPTSGTPTSPASGLPVPAPSDSDGIQVAGPVTVSVLSLTGPLQPAGPYLGTGIAALLSQFRAALGGSAPTCLPAGCWSGARVPANSVLLSVRPATGSCDRLHSIQTAELAAGSVRLDLQLAQACRPGQGTAARSAAMLFALSSASLPRTGRLSVLVRVSTQAGQPFQSLGTATVVRS
ncbi:MAG: hypothetical protein ACR2N4_16830 [Jatrophihabitans sp.]